MTTPEHDAVAQRLPAAAESVMTLPWKIRSMAEGLIASLYTPVKKRLYDLTIAIALPVLFLFSAPLQLFPPPGWVDAGIYLGLSLDYFDIIKNYGWSYYALRVSYLLPSFLTNLVLPPVPARLVIVTAFYLLGIVSLYTGARLLWGRLSATIAVAMLAYNPVYLAAITAGYVDGAYVAYLLALFATLAAWSQSFRDAWLVAAGAFVVLALLAHPLAAVPAGLMGIVFIILCWNVVVAHCLRLIVAFLFGAFATWVFFVYALSTVGFGISAFSSLKWIVTASVSGGLGANYRFPLEAWLPVTTRLVVPLLIIAALLALMEPSRRLGGQARQLAVLAVTVLIAALYPSFDLLFSGSLTQTSFYAGLALPILVMGTAEVSSKLAPSARPYRFAIALIVTFGALAAAWFGPRLWFLASAIGIPTDIQALSAVGFVVVLLIILSRTLAHPIRGIALVAFVGLQCVAVILNADTRAVFRPRGTINNIEFFQAAAFVRSMIAPRLIEGRRPIFWFHRPAFTTLAGKTDGITRPIRFGGVETSLTFFDTLAGLRLWDQSILLAEMTDRTRIDRDMLDRFGLVTLVVLGQDPTIVDQAREILGRDGIRCHLRRSETYRQKSFVLQVVLLDVVGNRERDSQSCES